MRVQLLAKKGEPESRGFEKVIVHKTKRHPFGCLFFKINTIMHSEKWYCVPDNMNLYGINIYYDTGEIEFDSLINPPRNREAGYQRVGRYVADPAAREKIEEVVRKWIQL